MVKLELQFVHGVKIEAESFFLPCRTCSRETSPAASAVYPTATARVGYG